MSPFKTVRLMTVRLTVCAGLLAMAGCASTQTADKSTAPVIAPTASLPDGSVRSDTGNQRIAVLWSSAERARQENDDARALENIYEALEIDPRNGLLWSRAAEIQLDNQQPAQAENMAMKSNSFSGDNASLLYRNWLIIEHARDMRGDLLGVRSAHKKVQEYQNR